MTDTTTTSTTTLDALLDQHDANAAAERDQRQREQAEHDQQLAAARDRYHNAVRQLGNADERLRLGEIEDDAHGTIEAEATADIAEVFGILQLTSDQVRADRQVIADFYAAARHAAYVTSTAEAFAAENRRAAAFARFVRRKLVDAAEAAKRSAFRLVTEQRQEAPAAVAAVEELAASSPVLAGMLPGAAMALAANRIAAERDVRRAELAEQARAFAVDGRIVESDFVETLHEQQGLSRVDASRDFDELVALGIGVVLNLDRSIGRAYRRVLMLRPEYGGTGLHELFDEPAADIDPADADEPLDDPIDHSVDRTESVDDDGDANSDVGNDGPRLN
ncbi:MAG: hypothetical protein AAF916_06995 [Planctomycetota bacterium]